MKWVYSKKYSRLIPLSEEGLQKFKAARSEETCTSPRRKSEKGWISHPSFCDLDDQMSKTWKNMKSHNSDRRPFALSRAKRRHLPKMREL